MLTQGNSVVSSFSHFPAFELSSQIKLLSFFCCCTLLHVYVSLEWTSDFEKHLISFHNTVFFLSSRLKRRWTKEYDSWLGFFRF